MQIIEQIYTYGKTEREMATELGISQVAVHKQKLKVLDKLKKFLEKWKYLVIKIKKNSL